MDLYIFEVHFPANAVRRLLLNQSVGARPSYSVLRMLIQEKIPNSAFSLTWQDGKKEKHPCEAQTDLNLAIDDLAGRKTQLPTLASSSVVLHVTVLPLPSRSEPALEADSSSIKESANGLPHHGPSSPTPASNPDNSGADDQVGIKRKTAEISPGSEVVSSKSRLGFSRVLRPRSDASVESKVCAKPVSSNLKPKPTASKPKSGGATYYTCAICSTNFFSSATLAKHSSTCMTPVIEGPQTMPPATPGYDVSRPVHADDSMGPEGPELTAGPTPADPLDHSFRRVQPDPLPETESVHQDDDNSSSELYILPSRSTVYKAGSFALECLECGLRFATGDTLTEHELAHHADRRFVCDECGSGFREETLLAEHQEEVHGRRRYRLRSHYEDNDGTLLPLPSRSNGTSTLPETGIENSEQESRFADSGMNEHPSDSAEVRVSPSSDHQEDASAPSQPRVKEMIVLPDGVCAVRRGNKYRRLCRQAGCSRFPYKKDHCYPHFVLSTKGAKNSEPGQSTSAEALPQQSAHAPVVSPRETPELTPEKKESKRCGFFSCANFSRRDGYCLTHYKKSKETQEDDVVCVGEVVIHPRPGPVPIKSPKKQPPFAFPQLNDPFGKVVLNTVKGNYRCDVCGSAFEYNTHLGVHLLSHIGSVTLKRPALVAPVPPPPPTPPSAEASSPSTGAADRGQLQVVLKAGVHFVLLGGQFLCLFCGEKFARNVDLVPHLLAHLRTPQLSNPTAKPGTGVVGPCSICGMVFTDNMIFLQHLEEHIRSSNPADVPALARKGSSLRKPTLKLVPTEFSGTPVRCHACERWFDGQGLLDRHFKAHPKHALAKAPVLSPQQILSKLPSISASVTPSSSTASSGAAQSTSAPASVYQSVLPKSMVDPTFDCTQCDKKFTSPELLKKHGLTHKKPKPPGMTCLCKICHQIFPTVIDFRKHMEDNVHVNAEFRATPFINRPPGSDPPVCGPVQLEASKQRTPKEDDPDTSPSPKVARVVSPKVLAIRRLKKRLLAIKTAKTLEPADPSVTNADPDSLVMESDLTDVLGEEDRLREGGHELVDVPAVRNGNGNGLFESQKRPSQMVYNLATNWDLWKSSPRKMSNADLAARITGTLSSGRDPYDSDAHLSDEEVAIEEYVHQEEQEIECPITEVDVSSAMETAEDSHALLHDRPVLWRFLRELLDDTEEFPPCVTWVEEDNGRAKGVFRVPQRFTVAQKWSELNSENRKTGRVAVLDFDRDIRTSIDKSMLVLLDKKKNIFRFGVAASGWNRESQG